LGYQERFGCATTFKSNFSGILKITDHQAFFNQGFTASVPVLVARDRLGNHVSVFWFLIRNLSRLLFLFD